jgi:protein-L-isoaspartate(D-aspartate) O-methyltransferase
MLGWVSSGATNSILIENLQKNIQLSDKVVSAFLKVDRANYCLDPTEGYYDRPQPIGYGATISAPHMHALAMKLMEPCLLKTTPTTTSTTSSGAAAADDDIVSVLDVGSGSGYLSAVIASYLEEEYGKSYSVVGIDHIPQLVEWSMNNVQKDGKGYLLETSSSCHHPVEASDDDVKHSSRVSPLLTLVVGDGYEGYLKNAPYDVIHVGAAAESIPEKLLQQLKPNGYLIIPVGSSYLGQDFCKIVKSNDNKSYKSEIITTVRYVPLTTPEKQLGIEK